MINIDDEGLIKYQEILKNANLEFNEERHKYTVDGEEYPSVSALLKDASISPDFSQVEPEILERARARGEAIHLQVEEALKNGNYEFCEEEALAVLRYLRDNLGTFNKENKWQNIISEGFLYCKNEYRNFCGRFDLLIEGRGKYFLYDIKTAKNETAVSRNAARWQLNLYAYALAKTFNIRVSQLALLRFEKEGERTFIKFEKLEFLKKEEVEKFLKEGKAETPPIKLKGDEVALFSQIIQKQEEIKELEKQVKGIKDAIYIFMKERDILSTESADGSLRITRVQDTESIGVDAERLREENPEIYDKYKKITPRKGYIKISLKKGVNYERF